ncbi:alcohol acetyltransferase [Mortierella sp. GBAus27b]|nr:hypothetical protein BGX31_001282 [Mortierella sp. GBA43]KAI8363720.1 alcohol acetyltransferase [Mortierella sp. GBAus27b]
MTLTPDRKVHSLERYSVARSNVGTYYNVSVGTRLKLQSNGNAQAMPADKEQWLQLLKGPLTWLIQNHPTLSVTVGDHLSGTPTFYRLPSVDLSKLLRVTRIQQRSEIAKVLEDEHATVFDLSNQEVPLWRVVVAHVSEDESFYLIYTFQHVIGDGRCAQVLTEQLVHQMNVQAGSDNTQLPTVVISSNKALPLALEQRINTRPPISTLLKEASFGLLLPAFIKKLFEPKYWAGEFDATLDVPHECLASVFHLTQQETSQLVKAAKAHNTTVQAILFTASNFAIKSTFLSKVKFEHGSKVPTTTKDKLSFSTPVSLRPLISPKVDVSEQGTFTSEIISKDIKIQLDTGFWDLTQSYRQRVVKDTTTPKGVSQLIHHIGLLEYLPKKAGGWEDFLKSQIVKEPHGRGTTLMLSNIGKAWDQPETEQGPPITFKVQDAIFSQSAGVTCSAFSISAATANGILSVSSTWQKATFSSRERGDLYLQEFKRILLQAIEPDRKTFIFRDAVVSSPVVAVDTKH